MINKLTELIAERDQLNAEIERLEQHKGAWRPEMDKTYYYVNSFASINETSWANDKNDKERLSIGNVYRTRALAQAHLDYLTALTTIKNYIADNDLGLVPDWGDEDQRKFTIYYNHDKKEWKSYVNWQNQYFSPFGYLKSDEACNQLIKARESELMIVLNYE